MIRGIRANRPAFRKVTFTPGVNVILADRSNAAGEKDTTNALGKSTLIDIVDFCLGSSASPGKGLRVPALEGWAFTTEMEVAGRMVAVTRSVAAPAQIEIEGKTEGWIVEPLANKEGVRTLSVERWRSVLAGAFFGIREIDGETGYGPSARALLSYFVRNQPAAYITPFKYFDNQKVWNVQIHNAFLLGLNWEKAASWQRLKDQKNALDALKQAIKTGAVVGELATLGELEAERVRLSNQLQKEEVALQNFRVLPQYREVESQANALTGEIHRLLNSKIIESRRLERYREVLQEEDSPSNERLAALYEEAGVALADSVIKTLDQALAFNEQLVVNRKHFIQSEIDALQRSVEQKATAIEELTNRRSEYLTVLAGQGALDEFNRLQSLHTATKSRVGELTNRISQIRQMTARADTIKVEAVQLKRATEVDYEERREIWSEGLSLFSDFSEQLYKTAGRLVIDIDDTGYKFDVEIAGSPSEGIGKMKIFCYDLTLISLARRRGFGIDFLVHDSTIFDGVDPRQRAHAIELADSMSKKYGFQYILTLNTDMVPTTDFSDGFEFEKLVRLRLTDTDPTGSLLGFRF